MTKSDVDAALSRLQEASSGKHAVLHGIGYLLDQDDGPGGGNGQASVPGELAFVRVGDNEQLLAAAVLVVVTGWEDGAGWITIDRRRLDAAIGLLEQFESERQVPLSTLSVWRDLRSWDWLDVLIVVFDVATAVESVDPYVVALREVVGSGRQAVPSGKVGVLPIIAVKDHPFQVLWRQRWPQVPPISYCLKTDGSWWVRFHSLPDSKRYADDESEYAILLERHNTVLEELRGQAERLKVVTVEVTFTPRPGKRTAPAQTLLPVAERWAVLSWPDLEPELAFAHVYVSEVPWKTGRFDELFRAVADAQLAHVIIAPPDLGWLYAPYDGGADILLSQASHRDRLREQHRSWLSAQPSGL